MRTTKEKRQEALNVLDGVIQATRLVWIAEGPEGEEKAKILGYVASVVADTFADVEELEAEVKRLNDHLLRYEGRAMAAKQEANAAYRDACQMAAKSQLSEEGLAAQVEQNRKLKAVVDAVRTTVHVKTCYETDDYGDCACGVCIALAALDSLDDHSGEEQ